MTKHILTLDTYNRYEFTDALDAFKAYELLCKSKKLQTIYPKHEDGTTDYDKPEEVRLAPTITISLT